MYHNQEILKIPTNAVVSTMVSQIGGTWILSIHSIIRGLCGECDKGRRASLAPSAASLELGL